MDGLVTGTPLSWSQKCCFRNRNHPLKQLCGRVIIRGSYGQDSNETISRRELSNGVTTFLLYSIPIVFTERECKAEEVKNKFQLLENGVKYLDLREGTGAIAQTGDKVVNYLQHEIVQLKITHF